MTHWHSFIMAGAALALLAGCAPKEKAQEAEKPVEAAFAAVDTNRIATASGGAEWLTYGGTYDEQRFSTLTGINAENVGRLGVAWTHDLDTNRGVEATPIVVDGVMYVTSAWSVVYAMDARTGDALWTYDPDVDRAVGVKACCDVVNRGVAVLDGSMSV
jgi:glucose dehydrogenase